MITLWEGNTGQGKTYMLAQDMLRLLHRNKRWYEKKKTKTRRMVATNLAVSDQIKKEFKDYLFGWVEMEQLVSLRECDVIFDDMSAYLDSQRWMDTPMSVKRWLRLHEHYGCDIYGNAQDFLTIDPSVRRLTGQVRRVMKLMGSHRPYSTKPIVRYVWGVLMIREVAREDMDKDEIQRKHYKGLPSVEFLRRKNCNVFDTTQDLDAGEFPPLYHIARTCLTCGETKTRHV